MRISQPRLETHEGRTRTVATITWEDCARPSMEMYFETDPPFADALSPHPDAFLAAAVLPAMRFGERRIAVEGDYCPYQKSGLETAMALVRSWRGPTRRPVVIEGHPRSTSPANRGNRAAFYMSGGVDSLSTLRRNRLNIPRDHPASVRDGILIFGLEIAKPEIFPHVVAAMSQVAQLAECTLLPVYTNVRYLVDDWHYWVEEFEGAVLASVALALGRRLSTIYIPSSYDFPALYPHGSHPLLDPQFSTYEVRFHHDASLTRFEKTKILADWPEALPSLRVCNKTDLYKPGVLNCGRCEKCLRTLTALMLLDRLDAARAFAHREVAPDLLRNIRLTQTDSAFWLELLGPLRASGRGDLVRAIEERLKEFHGPTGWRRTVRDLDRKFLGGSLSRLKRATRFRSARGRGSR